MKILGILIACVTLFLSVSPCCPEKDDCKEEAELACHNQHSENENETSCSPFFSCGTCLGFNLQGLDFNLTASVTEGARLYTFYPGFRSNGFELLPLKPPRQIKI